MMERTLKLNGRPDSAGRLLLDKSDRLYMEEWLRSKQGRELDITLSVCGRKRSHEQNRYYWGVIVRMVKAHLTEEWGEMLTDDDTHELLKAQCNTTEIERDGKSVRMARSTKDLTTAEFEEYAERCRRFASEFLGMYIPDPNEYDIY